MVIRVLEDGSMLIKSLSEKVCSKSKIFVVFVFHLSPRDDTTTKQPHKNLDVELPNLPNCKN